MSYDRLLESFVQLCFYFEIKRNFVLTSLELISKTECIFVSHLDDFFHDLHFHIFFDDFYVSHLHPILSSPTDY